MLHIKLFIFLLTTSSIFILTHLSIDIVHAECPASTLPSCTSNPNNGGCYRQCVGSTCQTSYYGTLACDDESNNECNSDADCGPVTPPCTESDPAPATLIAPLNNSTIPSNIASFAWSSGGSFGVSCPTNSNEYTLYLSQNCTATFTNIGSLPESIDAFQRSNLEWDTQYCWYVRKSNGNRFIDSIVWNFTTRKIPIKKDFTVIDTCGNGITGRKENALTNVSNPLPFEVKYEDSHLGSSFEEIQFVFVKQNPSNQSTYIPSTLYNIYQSGKSLAIRLITNGAQNRTQIGWDPLIPSSGNYQNSFVPSTATILNSGLDSKMIIESGGLQATGSAKVEFDLAYPEGLYDIYAMGIVRSSDGTTLISDGATSAHNLLFTKVSTWKFDMRNPSALINETSYVGNNFSAKWSAFDVNDIKEIFPYIWADKTGSVLKDVTNLSIEINPFGIVELSYPSPTNGLITKSDLSPAGEVVRNYNYSGDSVNYNFKLVVEDNACNLSEQTTNIGVPKPWLSSKWGLISASGGITDIEIPLVSSTFIPNLSNPSILEDIGTPTFADFTVISGDSSLPFPTTAISGKSIYVSNYLNQAVSPDPRGGESRWYEYIRNLLSKNENISSLSENALFKELNSTNISSYIDLLFGLKSNENDIYFINAPTTTYLFENITCDRKVIIATSLSIQLNPPVRKSIEGGCVFVTQSDMEILSGEAKTNIDLEFGGNSEYDIVEAYLLTDGTFIAKEDQVFKNDPLAQNKQWDGVLIKGGLIALDVNIDRTLNSTGNGDQPAFVVQYDPFYSYVFRDAFALRYYSIREFVP